ncbi:early nodulin-like protein 1 [Euphorbia peplus]|nr:early nodulin-like protein 1 [Euphorbia peplus]
MGSLVWVLLTLCCSVLFSSSQAYNFYVGGTDGWVSNPPETYNHWAERNRFQVNDTLTFKMKQGSESVLVVKKDDYYSCNTNNPIMKSDASSFVLTLDDSGPLFFISANKENCQKGQRLIVVVMAVRHNKNPSPPSSSLSPSPKPSSPSPKPSSPSPKSSSPSRSPSPAANSPKSSSPSPYWSLSPSPASSPKSSSPSPSWSLSPSPATSPTSSSPSPYWSPSPSPASSPKSPSMSPSPAAEGPNMSPGTSPVPGPSPSADSGSAAPAPTPESGETADVNSPAPADSKSGARAVTASTSMMLIMAFGVVFFNVVYGI